MLHVYVTTCVIFCNWSVTIHVLLLYVCRKVYIYYIYSQLHNVNIIRDVNECNWSVKFTCSLVYI